jgi:hypothetical protein
MPKARLPLEAVFRTGSRPVSTRKGRKGYERSRMKEQEGKISKEEASKENN